MPTTILRSPETRQKLARLKSPSRETNDWVLNELLALVPEGDEEGLHTQSFRVGPLNARVDIKDGRLIDHETSQETVGSPSLWSIQWTERAVPDLDGLDPPLARWIVAKPDPATENPDRFFHPPAGPEEYKLRLGDYRLLAILSRETRTILTERVPHRLRVYARGR